MRLIQCGELIGRNFDEENPAADECPGDAKIAVAVGSRKIEHRQAGGRTVEQDRAARQRHRSETRRDAPAACIQSCRAVPRECAVRQGELVGGIEVDAAATEC